MDSKSSHNRNPTGKGGFKKGQSGNPAGRPPKGEAFAEVLRAALEAPGPGGRTAREHIVSRAVAMAMAGDLDAIKFVVERSDGKVKDTLAVEGEGLRVEVAYRDETASQ